jgi:hypothetical protein
MNRLLIAFCMLLSAMPLSGCTPWGIYSGGAQGYTGYYDGYYGPIHDGYWGSDGYFYFRGFEHDRHFRRGDPAHFRRDAPNHGQFQPMTGSVTPSNGTRLRNFTRKHPPHVRDPIGDKSEQGGAPNGSDSPTHP